MPESCPPGTEPHFARGKEQRADQQQRERARLRNCDTTRACHPRFDDGEGLRLHDVEGLRAGGAGTEEVEAHAETAENAAGCDGRIAGR